MLSKPYFCPNCKSNRFKFSRMLTLEQPFFKDAVTGELLETHESQPVLEEEPTIKCMVCQFAGNEMRFVKQAENNPRTPTGQPRPS
jgi:hypothetical protein